LRLPQGVTSRQAQQRVHLESREPIPTGVGCSRRATAFVVAYGTGLHRGSRFTENGRERIAALLFGNNVCGGIRRGILNKLVIGDCEIAREVERGVASDGVKGPVETVGTPRVV